MKRIINCILFVTILIGLFSNHMFKIVRENVDIKFEYDNLDILGIGNSNLYSGLSPQQLYKDYQYKSILFASANQTIEESYEILNAVLLVQKPRYVLWDVDNVFSSYNSNESKDIDDNHQKGKIKDLKKLRKRPRYLDEYGYMTSETMIPSLIKQRPSKYQILDSSLQYFDLIVDTCRNNNIQLLLIYVPNLSSWNKNKYIKIKELSDKYHLQYWDMNKKNYASINWFIDTRDGGIHLNNNGAYKVTHVIGESLKNLKSGGNF